MSDFRVVRAISRPDRALVDGLRSAGATTAYEAAGRSGLLPHRLRPLQAGMTIAGPAVTVTLPPDDNLMIHAAVELCEPGDVLLVVPTASSTHGMVGELLATALAAHGVAGLIIDAGVRDVARLARVVIWTTRVTGAGLRPPPRPPRVEARCHGGCDVPP